MNALDLIQSMELPSHKPGKQLGGPGDLTNKQRAWSGLVLSSTMTIRDSRMLVTDDDARDAISDLLHFMHSNCWDVAEELKMAVDSFLEECGAVKEES